MLRSVSRAANGTVAQLICINRTRRKSVGIFHGDTPLHYPSSVLLAQLASSSLITAALQFVLAPVGQTAFVCQMLGGILLGPQALGKHLTFLQSIYHTKSMYVLNTVSLFASALFLFLIGVKTDIRLLTASGRKALVIGSCAFFVPLVLNLILAFALMTFIKLERQVHNSLHFVAILQSLNSFYVIACQLDDLKMLSSELGRLALSSSLVSGTLSWCWAILVFATTESYITQMKGIVLWAVLCTMGFMLIVIYIFKPFVQLLVKRVHRVRGVKEGHMFVVYISVLGFALFGDIMGLNFMFGPMVVGIMIPVGPPIGSAVVDKLEILVSTLLLPMFYSIGTTLVNLSTVSAINVFVMELLVLVGFFGKALGAMVPCLLSKMPVSDAISLGLILATQGITDLLMLLHAMELKFVDKESYSIVLISMLVVSGISTPVVKRLYKPPNRYVSYNRRTIQHSKPEAELRVVACLYNHDNTPSIINLLELSNPQIQSTICVYLLHLMRQTGTASTFLYAHSRYADDSSSLQDRHYSDHIINAFRQYENRKDGKILVNAFTAISPYITMHEDVCNLALTKRAAMIIVPFHQQLSMENEVASAPAIRSVNLNILRAAPCSVAILIDRGARFGSFHSMNCEASRKFNIGVFFLGGQDDREALYYAMRMGEHPEVSVTLINFLDSQRNASKPSFDKKQNISITDEFRLSCKVKQKNTYREELPPNSVELVSKIRAMDNLFDMIIVGRRHSGDCELLEGLQDWNEYPELGCIADMLATHDSSCRASVLVVQQQTFVEDDFLDSPKYQQEREFCAVVSMASDKAKIFPGLDDPP